jgi:hypothetical protein
MERLDFLSNYLPSGSNNSNNMEKTISSKITFVLITSDDTSQWWNYLDEEAF